MRFGFALIAVAALFFYGCGTKTFTMLQDKNEPIKSVDDANYTEEVDFEWKIARGDRVEIVVATQNFGETTEQFNPIVNTPNKMQASSIKDGSEGFLVPKDGFIRMPLIGMFKIMGLTEAEAIDRLTIEYKKYLKNPYVTVKILNQKIFVLGEVKKPGVVPVLNGTINLFEALAHSGDLTDAAERTNIKIVRGGLRTPQVREVNVADMSALKLSSLILRPNDIVYVQPRGMKPYNVAFEEQTTFFKMLHFMLLPFVDYTTIKKGNAVDVFQ